MHILTNEYTVIDPWFGRTRRPLEMDMGCGKGALTLALAARFPDRLIVGTDLMIGRLRKVQKASERARLTNIELLRAENAQLAAFQLPDRCVSRLHILCPDPWPKARHRSKRLITSEFLGWVHRILVPDGVLHVSTDHRPYVETLERVVSRSRLFASDTGVIADIADIETGFEAQWRLQGKPVPHLGYRRLA
ncbi:MAG: tRNA (guanine(46)-N(7))-methyltransferase TrmB [Verrucomicrobiota bacterium]